MKIVGFLLMLALIALPDAAAASDTFRCSDGVVTTTSSLADVLKRCGRPDRTVRLENEQGAAAGERWEYFIGEKVVAFTIQESKVVRIDEV